MFLDVHFIWFDERKATFFFAFGLVLNLLLLQQQRSSATKVGLVWSLTTASLCAALIKTNLLKIGVKLLILFPSDFYSCMLYNRIFHLAK